MEVPRRLESEMAGAALEAVLSSRAASISDSSSVDEANEESLMIKVVQAGLVRLLEVVCCGTKHHHLIIASLFHPPPRGK